jgi:hypothetical protein
MNPVTTKKQGENEGIARARSSGTAMPHPARLCWSYPVERAASSGERSVFILFSWNSMKLAGTQ